MSAGDLTQLINRAAKGDKAAVEELWNLIQPDAQVIALSRLKRAGEAGDISVNQMINEAWIGLNGSRQGVWENRAHFFGALGRQMTQFLFDTWRKNNAERRRAPVVDQSLSRVVGAKADSREPLSEEEIDQGWRAWRQLEEKDPVAARVFELRMAMGKKPREIAHNMSLTVEEVQKRLRFAKAHMEAMRRRWLDRGRE